MRIGFKRDVAAIQVSGTEYVEANSPIQLMCNATGRPEPPHNVDWFKDDTKVRSDAHGGVIITKKIETRVLVSMLVIKQSRLSDSGTYVCRSSNGEAGSIVVHVLSGMLCRVICFTARSLKDISYKCRQ